MAFDACQWSTRVVNHRNGDDYEKFSAWAETLEACIGNPLYVWTDLELKRFFGIEELLTKKNATIIWKKAN